MSALIPAPAELGLESPALGPWFSVDVTLAAPDPDLGVPVAIPAGEAWLPPTAGLLSAAVATTPRPAVLTGLRRPDGEPAFDDGRLIVTFRLLPEVEERLAALLADVPPPDGSTGDGTTITRARPRTFAVQLPENPPTLAAIADRLVPPADLGSGPAERAAHIGLTLDGTDLGNGPAAMTDLYRPGVVFGVQEKLLEFAADTTVRLYAFDHRGRPIDPGAIAAWWERLATSFTNLRAPGVDPSSPPTATTADNLGIHLVGAHEGPVPAGVLARLQTTNVDGTGLVRTRREGTDAATLTLTGGTADDAPVPRIAALPAGPYSDTVSLWPGGPADGMTRDFVRVALVDVEDHLVGVRRATTSTDDGPVRRAADQARVSTRTEVRRATTATDETVLLATTDEAMAAFLEVLRAGDGTVVAPVLERAAGALGPPTGLPAVAPPDILPAATVTALTGGGSEDSGVVVDQRVVLEIDLGPSMTGAWVRVWPQVFDARTGRHLRAAGGGGRVQDDAAGRVSVVVRLPDGAVSPDARLAFDVLVVTATGARRYPEVRLARPAPVGGSPIALSDVTVDVVVCETGAVAVGGAVPPDSVPSGATLVARSTPPALVDLASVPATVMSPETVARSLGSGDTVHLTEPAWIGQRGGEEPASLGSTGATVTRTERDGLTRLVAPGAPLPAMSRDTVAAGVLTATAADGAIAAVRPLARHHELPPHQLGHPGAPADDERHGTGARLRGPAVVALAEVLRERTSGTSPELATAAASPLATPSDPTVPGSWAAVLRTVGFGVEAEPGLAAALHATGAGAYPFGGTLDDIRTWLSGQGITLPGGIDAAATSVVRALDRRLRGAANGYREAAQSIAAAFARAEDLVYVETPALDDVAFGGGGDELRPLEVLRERLDERRGLHVLICLPVRLSPGVPAKLQRVRDALARDAIDALRAAAGGTAADRIAVFAPTTGPGRSLHLDATTVVVDDAWALTGGAHLWRRGLTFDASLSVAVVDERLTDGRPAEITAFRRAEVAGRLGMDPSLLPADPEDLVVAVRSLADRGGGTRLAPEPLEVPDPQPSADDREVWNPDGSPTPGFDPMAWLTGLDPTVSSEIEAEVPS